MPNPALRLVLDYDGVRGHLVAVAQIPYPEADQIASAQLAVDAKVDERQFANPTLQDRKNWADR